MFILNLMKGFESNYTELKTPLIIHRLQVRNLQKEFSCCIAKNFV